MFCGVLFAAPSFAGSSSPIITAPVAAQPSSDGFASARRPISNPTLFDLALPSTNIHPILMFQQMPDYAAIVGGGRVPLGGDFSVIALQFEYAFNDRLSLVATKDGYVDFNPDNTLSEEEGFANLAAGLKYAFILQPENQFALSGTATFEFPTGQDRVTQGSGDGAVNLIASTLKLAGPWQLAAGAGVHLPFDNDAESTTSFVSAHASYNLCRFFQPLVEVNWYRVLSEGDGGSRYSDQAGGALPSVIAFEGGDLLNWGASNGKDNSDIVTLAAGFRSSITDNVDLGVAYEIPLTDNEENLMENRITIDAVISF